jgi:hypothetical protein
MVWFGGEKMEEKQNKNKVFDAIAWGVFIVILGVGWIVSIAYQVSTTIYIALGVGIVLIGLNYARWASKIKISKFSLFVGLVAFALSGSGIAGFEMPFIPTVVLLVGMFIAAEAIQKTVNRKALQPQ